MTKVFEGKTRAPADLLAVEVLGGKFVIKEVLLESGQSPEQVAEMVGETPAERWFVMLAEGGEAMEDILAIIDDQFEFQPIAVGTLESE